MKQENYKKKIIDEKIIDNKFTESFHNKTIVLLCCYEAVEQNILLHNPEFNKKFSEGYYDTEDISSNKKAEKFKFVDEKHREWIIESIIKKEKINAISSKRTKEENDKLDILFNKLIVVYVPYWEHNQHTSIFLKSISKDNPIVQNIKHHMLTVEASFRHDLKSSNEIQNLENDYFVNYNYLVEAGFHMYRKGFSNSLNPIKLNTEKIDNKVSHYAHRDIDKLLLFFYQVLCRGISYQVQLIPEKEYPVQLIIDELRFYRSWDPKEFYERMQIFMSKLYTLVNNNNK